MHCSQDLDDESLSPTLESEFGIHSLNERLQHNYIIPQPSFPSSLNVENIDHSIESYIDYGSNCTSRNISARTSIDSFDAEHNFEAHEDETEALREDRKEDLPATTGWSPVLDLRSLTAPTSIPTANISLLSARTVSTRTRDINSKLLRRKSVAKPRHNDPNLVTWESADDPLNPHNWPQHRKWISTVLIAAYAFIAPMASTMVAPALDDIADEFNIEQESVEAFLVMSIFLLAFAIGPFLWGPLSEVFGRARVMQGANLIFLLFNTICGFAKTKEQMMAFRFLSGIGGSAPQAIGGGVVSDCFRAGERGTAVAIYSLMPFISPAIAPIIGGYATQYTTWRWAFWSTSIFNLALQILCVFLLRETFAPAILGRKCKKLKLATGNQALHTKWQGPDHTTQKLMMKSLIRPFIMLTTQPALQAMALYRAGHYGIMYLVFATFPMVFEDAYDQSVGRASLNYLSLGLGFVTGLQFSKSSQDKIYMWCKEEEIDPTKSIFITVETVCRKLRRQRQSVESNTAELLPTTTRSGVEVDEVQTRHLQRSDTKKSFSHDPTKGLPEYRLPLLLPFSLFIPIGLFIYGWAAQAKVHWIVPNIGCVILAMGLIVCFNCAQAYVVDTYTTYSASATGAAAFVRTMAGFSFPLFAPSMYTRLGVGWGNSVLAFVMLTFGLAAPFVLWRWGTWLRSKSTYCTE